MTRIICPHCHVPLATSELEQVLIAGRLGLLCPDCSGLLFLQTAAPAPSASLEVHCTEITDA